MSCRVFIVVFVVAFIFGVTSAITLSMIPGGLRRRITCYDEVYNPLNQSFLQPQLIYSYPPEPYHRSIIADQLVLIFKEDGMHWLLMVSDNISFAFFVSSISAFCVFIMRSMFSEKPRNKKKE